MARRIFLDVTASYFQGERGGIPRVTRKYAAALRQRPDVDVTCFVHAGNGFYEISPETLEAPRGVARQVKRLRAALRIRDYPRLPLYSAALSLWHRFCAVRMRLMVRRGGARRITAFEAGDIVLMTFFAQSASFGRLLQRLNRGATVAAIVHDLFPVAYPEQLLPEVQARFARGLDEQMRIADVLVAVSHRTASDVVRYLEDHGLRKPVRVVHLGSDVTTPDRQDTRTAVPTLLSVGTCEPRKNYGYAIALLERLWAMGEMVHYVIVGGRDMAWTGISDAIRNHPEFGKRLFLHHDTGDAELVGLYRSSDFLLATSMDEGFGLPVMEAWRYGLPVICSDIAIFRELNPANHFIPLDNAAAAATRIAHLLGTAGAARAAVQSSPRPVALLSWDESTERLLAALETPAETARSLRVVSVR